MIRDRLVVGGCSLWMQVCGKSKMKKSFCAPGDVEFCPALSIATVFALRGGSLTISRSPENGGDKTYSVAEELRSDFAAGETVLHPGDLKAAAGTLILSALEPLAAALKGHKAAKTLQAFHKKQSKKKK